MGVRKSKSLFRTVPLLALLLLAAGGASIVLTYLNPSTLTTSVVAPPVQFVAGDDAGPSLLSRYVTAYSISANKTYVSITVKGVPEASLLVDSLFKLTNVDTSSHGVVLSTSQVTNTYVTAYTLKVYNSSSVLQGTMDLTAASPSVSFTLPAGATYRAALTLSLASGAGAHNVALSNSVTLSVS